MSQPIINKSFTLTLIKAQEKINFQNIFDKEIDLTLKCSSQ